MREFPTLEAKHCILGLLKSTNVEKNSSFFIRHFDLNFFHKNYKILMKFHVINI